MYKRQDIPLNVQGAFVETEELAGFDAADYEAGGDGWAGNHGGHKIEEDEAGKGEPVSYTHLDVYKRQEIILYLWQTFFLISYKYQGGFKENVATKAEPFFKTIFFYDIMKEVLPWMM